MPCSPAQCEVRAEASKAQNKRGVVGWRGDVVIDRGNYRYYQPARGLDNVEGESGIVRHGDDR